MCKIARITKLLSQVKIHTFVKSQKLHILQKSKKYKNAYRNHSISFRQTDFFSVFLSSTSTTKRVGSSVASFCCCIFVEFSNCATATSSPSFCANSLKPSEYSLTRASREGLKVSWGSFFVSSSIDMLLYS
jgi:hypothetical protein